VRAKVATVKQGANSFCCTYDHAECRILLELNHEFEVLTSSSKWCQCLGSLGAYLRFGCQPRKTWLRLRLRLNYKHSNLKNLKRSTGQRKTGVKSECNDSSLAKCAITPHLGPCIREHKTAQCDVGLCQGSCTLTIGRHVVEMIVALRRNEPGIPDMPARRGR